MRNFWAILTKEIRSYFVSPVGYAVAVAFLIFWGFMFRNILMEFNQICMTYMRQPTYGRMVNLNPNEFVLLPFFGLMNFTALWMVPILTMRLYAEERKSGTVELLMTSPITTIQTLLGKFFACFAFYGLVVLLSLVYSVILEIYGEPDWGPILSAYAGALLVGAALISIGIFASSLTENQIIAVALSVASVLILWLIHWPANFAGPLLGGLLKYLSITEHLADFQRGVIDTKDVIFYLSFSVFGLFLTATIIESRRWRE